MAHTATKVTLATPRKAAPQAKVVAPTGNTPQVASPPVSTTAPLFTCTAATWPVKSQGGITIRAYAFKVAVQLAKANKKGFTLAQYKAALVAGQVGKGAVITGFALPSAGWASHNMPTWTSNPKQAWLVPA